MKEKEKFAEIELQEIQREEKESPTNDEIIPEWFQLIIETERIELSKYTI